MGVQPTKIIVKNLISAYLWPVFLFLFATGMPEVSYAQSNEQVTVAAYYPSPFGSYDSVRLIQRASAPACNGPNEWGTIYYDGNALLVCENDGAGGGAWSASSDNVWDRNRVNQRVYLRNLNDFVSIGDNTPEFKLTLNNDGGMIAKGAFGSGTNLTTTGTGTRFVWYPKKAALRAGRIIANEWDDINIGTHSVALGLNNRANDEGSVISGGEGNLASGEEAGFPFFPGYFLTIAGGGNNQVVPVMRDLIYATIGGGFQNLATSNQAVVRGGIQNQAGRNEATLYTHATVSGGVNNLAESLGATVSGGANNEAGGGPSGGGVDTRADTVSGGMFNTVYGNPPKRFRVISGGGGRNANEGNQALGNRSYVGGGQSNQGGDILGGGGLGQPNSGGRILGGSSNTVDSGSAIGGFNNNIDFVGAGETAPVISGGSDNDVGGGGSGAVISGGRNNTNGYDFSVVPGGQGNRASGWNSWSGGHNMQADPNMHGTFLWGDSSACNNMDRLNRVYIFPCGGGHLGINVSDPGPYALDVDGGVIMQVGGGGNDQVVIDANGELFRRAISSRRYKENIRNLSIDPNLVFKLSPARFTYKSTKNEDIGLIAEEVNEVIPDLVNYDKEGRPDSVRYDKVSLYVLAAVKDIKSESDDLKKETLALEQKAASLEKLLKKKYNNK